jgi:hypothetical protein
VAGCTRTTPHPTPTGSPAMSDGTPRRAVRIPDALWTAALTQAKDRGENLSDIIRAALVDYIENKGSK